MQKKRPKYLDLTKIRLPLPAFVSILHRVSGLLLFLSIPLLLYLLQGSLSSAETFAAYRNTVSHPLVKLILLGLLWAYMYHFCAGIRFLLLDVHQGIALKSARKSSACVLAISIILTLGIGAMLW